MVHRNLVAGIGNSCNNSISYAFQSYSVVTGFNMFLMIITDSLKNKLLKKKTYMSITATFIGFCRER